MSPITPTPTIVFTPLSSIYSEAPTSVSFSYTGDTLSTPEQLPYYKAEWKFLTTGESKFADSIASALSFSSSPTRTTSKNGIYRQYWSESTKQLGFFRNKNIVTLTYSSNPLSTTSFKLSNNTISGATLALQSLLPLASGFTYSPSSPSGRSLFNGIANPTNQSQAFSLYEYAITYNSIPLFIANYSPTPVRMTTSSSGSILSLSIAVPPTALQSLGVVNLLTTQQLLDVFQQGRGTLVYSGMNVGGFFEEAEPVFDSVELSDITLFYYIDPETAVAYPMFYCSGLGNDSTSGSVQKVIYVIPAFSSLGH